MTTRNDAPRDTADREITLSRIFSAPRELVFDAWTDGKHIDQWWGPRGFTNTTHAMDVRPGGVWRFIMHGPDGVDYPNHIAYHEVVRPERLVFDHGSGESDPRAFQVTVTFADVAGRTEMTMRMLFPTVEDCERTRGFGAVELGHQTLDCFGEHLAERSNSMLLMLLSDREIALTRVFDAPRSLVFEVMSTPEHVRQWWGPRRFTMTVREMDFRPGGGYHFVQREGDGPEYGFRGEYREIVPPERIVQTFEFEGMPRHISVETMTLEERDGKTVATVRSVFASPEDLQGMLGSGMEEGARESWDRLAEYVSAGVGYAH